MALSVNNGGGNQSTTQDPQVAGQPAFNGASTGSVQPGTSTNLLNGQGSIPLSNTPLTTVSLSAGASRAPRQQPTPAVHHWNPLLIVVAVILVLIAAGSVLLINRSAKNTTL